MTAPTDGAPAPKRRRLRWLSAAVLLLAVAGGIRVWVMEVVSPVRPLGDELYYVEVAANIARGRGHVYGENARALRPPAHPWLLSRFADPDALLARSTDSGKPELSLRLDALEPLLRVQTLLGTLLVLATLGLGWALFDARTGFLAGALAAVYPTLIAYSHYLWSETLFALLVTAAIAALVCGERWRRASLAAFAGLLFGGAALTREIALPVAGAAVAWAMLAAQRGERWPAARRGSCVLACAFFVVLPWTLRNHALFGRILPISSVGWIAVGEGNALDGAQWLRPSSPGRSEFRREVLAIDGEVERIDHARHRTLAIIAAQQPGWILRKLAHNVPLMLSPDEFQLYKLRSGSYGDVRPEAVRLIRAATVASTLLVLWLATLGIASAAAGERRLLAYLVLGTVLGFHVLANANSRFRVPWLPFLMVYAAHAAVLGREGLRALGRRARWTVAVVMLGIGGIAVSYFWVVPG